MQPIDTLVQQEQLRFTPVSGSFDVERIAAAVEGMGFSFRDDKDPSKFVMAADAEARDKFQARRRADPPGRFPYTPLVTVAPNEVAFSPVSSHPALRDLSVRFLDWLLAAYACRLVEDTGEDPTAEDLAGGDE